jgi:hypothetical protein
VLCNPVEGGLLEVPELCPGSHDFSLVHGFVLLVGHSLERLVLRGGGGVQSVQPILPGPVP